jgi:hypothetical protein
MQAFFQFKSNACPSSWKPSKSRTNRPGRIVMQEPLSSENESRHSLSASPAADPIKYQKSAREERKHSIQRVACGMGMSINGPENRNAKQSSEQPDNCAGQ